MLSVQQTSETKARLARIESALVRGSGLLGGLQVEQGVPEHWKSQVKETKELLQQATIDVIMLESEHV